MADKSFEYHELLSGFVRVHILHHAAEREIYGQWIMDELARHGYRLSPGTVYPMLRRMEARGYLKSRIALRCLFRNRAGARMDLKQ